MYKIFISIFLVFSLLSIKIDATEDSINRFTADYLKRINDYISDDDFENAIRELTILSTRYFLNEQSYERALINQLWGNVYAMQAQYDKAIDSYEASLRFRRIPLITNLQVRTNLAQCYFQVKNFKKVIEVLLEYKEQAEKRGQENEQPRPAIFQIGNVANSAVRNTCLSYLCYMISFSGMEFTLTFLAVERYLYEPKDITSMFLLIGFTLIFAQGFFVRRFVGKIGEKNMALQGIVLGFVAFLLLSLPSSETWFFFALFLMSCGVAFISPTLTALTSLHSSEKDQGFNLGIFRSSGSIARACGPMLAGLTYFLFGSTIAYSIGAFLLLIPFLILLRVPKAVRDEIIDES